MDFTNWPILAVGDYADLYWEETRAQNLRWEEGKLERFTNHQECGAGLRYWVGDENRYACADSPVAADIEKLAGQLWNGKLPPASRVINPAWPLTHRAIVRRIPADVPAAVKVDLLRRCHGAASLALVRQISISYGDIDKHIRIWTSD